MGKLQPPVTPADHILGSDPVFFTLVEYGDFECPHCGKAHAIMREVLEQFDGQLEFVFRNFPLTNIHPHAEMAAEAAEFAASHNCYWQMHDLIFENQKNLSLPLLLDLGKGLELPVTELERSITEKVNAHKIRTDFMSGVHSGVNGTPTFFINGERYDGPYADLLQVLKSVFAG